MAGSSSTPRFDKGTPTLYSVVGAPDAYIFSPHTRPGAVTGNLRVPSLTSRGTSPESGASNRNAPSPVFTNDVNVPAAFCNVPEVAEIAP